MRMAFWLAATGLSVCLWMTSAIAQDRPANPSLIDNPSNSGATSSKNGVDDRTGNANTMKSQGSPQTNGTVGSSVIPPTSPGAARNPSGSGTSTSGGVDYNGDHGADRMKR